MKALVYKFIALAMLLPSLSFKSIEANDSNLLFKITRSKDKNEIQYAVNIDASGNINTNNPIDIYWIKRENSNKKEPLTWVQAKYAYGLSYTKKQKELAKCTFVSYSKRELTIKKIKSNEFRVLCQINGSISTLKSIYVKISGGTFLVPKISYVEISGIRQADQAMVSEKIIPD